MNALIGVDNWRFEPQPVDLHKLTTTLLVPL